MKQYFTRLIVLTLAISFYGNAGATPGSDSAVQAAKQEESLQIYRKAINYNDLSTAAYSIVNYLNAGGNAAYNDTLAVIYYNMNNFSGSYKLANELYTKDAKNVTALTLLADISGRSGESKTSLEWYEKLCVLNPSAYNFYQLASKQFILERKLECRQSLQKVLADSANAMKEPVSLEVSNGYFEQVPCLAAAYNMLGVLAYNEKKTEEAKEYYTKAVAIAPKFVIAKQNLDGLKPGAPGKSAAKPAGAAKPKS